MSEMKDLTPKQIVKELDKYIIGQDDAKKLVAIALRNRWRRQQVEGNIKEEIIPNNIILIGSTGIWKTWPTAPSRWSTSGCSRCCAGPRWP